MTTTFLNGIQVSDKQIEELLGRLFEVGMPPGPVADLIESGTLNEAAEATRQAERDTVRRWLAALTVEAADDSDDDSLDGRPDTCDQCHADTDDEYYVCGDEHLCKWCYVEKSAEQAT